MPFRVATETAVKSRGAGSPPGGPAAGQAPRRTGSRKGLAEVRVRAVGPPERGAEGLRPAPRQVCPVCFAFATEDAAELNAHSEACFALAAQREAGAAPAAEAHFQRFLAHRALPLIQSCAVLMTLNSLGTVVRMALALSSPRWARNSSVLGYLPMLHSVSRAGPAPVTALRVPEEVARRICHLVLPCFALVRLPMMIALFVWSTSPSKREWCVRLRCAMAPHPPRARPRPLSAASGVVGQFRRTTARPLREPWSRAGGVATRSARGA